MKKILIISYYWPPSAGAGVQRWLKFSKYLPKNGWQPIIYTPENPDFSLQDASLDKDIPKEAIILKTKIWEPYGLYKKLLGNKGNSANAGFFSGEKKSWKQRLSLYIRGSFFIPDPRVFWVKPSIKHLSKYLQENPVDVIVSTGPPHSMHLIALGLKKRFPNIKWLADFRDPWTDIDFYQDLNLSKRADQKHHKLEEEVVQTADNVIVVSDYMRQQFSKLRESEVEVIRNGFDADDFQHIEKTQKKNDSFTLMHVGSMNKDRNHDTFWLALSELVNENELISKQLKVKLIGNIDPIVGQTIEKYQFENWVEYVSYLPHAESVNKMVQADMLYLSINNVPSAKGILTGKVFEYMAVDNPILCVGPKGGEIEQILPRYYCEFSDKAKIKQSIKSVFEGKQEPITYSALDYSRENLTKQLVKVLD